MKPKSLWALACSLLLCAHANLSSVVLADGPAPRIEERRFEVQFMSQMADHHLAAIKMGEACKEKATHAELKTMCEQIVQSQTGEIAQMKAWLKNWYGIDYEPRVPAESKRQMDEMAALSGAEWEIMFMKMMIRHHAMAIRMSADCLHESYHSELDQMCMSIIEAQLAEIKKMKTWLCDWYQICVGQGREDETGMPPRLQAATRESDALKFTFFAERDKVYAVDSSESLDSPQWNKMAEIAGLTGAQQVRSAIAPDSNRFFRLREIQ